MIKKFKIIYILLIEILNNHIVNLIIFRQQNRIYRERKILNNKKISISYYYIVPKVH